MEPLLFLAHRIPYPPNKGDKIRSWHWLKYLATRYRVYLGAFVDDPADRKYRDVLEQACAEVFLVDLDPKIGKLRSLSGLCTGAPLTLPYYHSNKLHRWVHKTLGQTGAKRVFVFSSAMAQYARGASDTDTSRIIDFVDVDSDKWRQYSDSFSGPRRWIYQRESRKLLRYEQRVASRFDANVFVSREELDLFKKLAPAASVRSGYIDNGVDTEAFSPARDTINPYREDEKVLVFTGAMDYWANVDAVCWFADQVFPAIRARVPEARFYIVGSNPTADVTALADRPGVEVTGAVPAMQPYLAHAHAAVAPLRIARGVQNKVLEAMAMARPVVATKAAMEGIAYKQDSAQDVVDESAALADLAARFLSSWSVDESARQWVMENHNWSASQRRLVELVESPIGAARAGNAGQLGAVVL